VLRQAEPVPNHHGFDNSRHYFCGLPLLLSCRLEESIRGYLSFETLQIGCFTDLLRYLVTIKKIILYLLQFPVLGIVYYLLMIVGTIGWPFEFVVFKGEKFISWNHFSFSTGKSLANNIEIPIKGVETDSDFSRKNS
jgi:hypothetical protein